MGFGEDDVLAFFMHNCPDYITCLTGAIGAGIIVTPINPSYTVDELAKQLSMSNSKGIITTNASLGLVKKALGQTKSKIYKKYTLMYNVLKWIKNERFLLMESLILPSKQYSFVLFKIQSKYLLLTMIV